MPFGFGWVNDILRSVSDMALDLIALLVLNVPIPTSGQWLNDLYSTGYTLALLLAIVVSSVTLLMAAFSTKRIRNAVEALVAVVLISFAGSVMFVLTKAVILARDTASNGLYTAISGNSDTTKPLIDLPPLANLGFSLIGLIVVSLLACFLFLIVVFYQIQTIVFQWFILAVLSLTPSGDGAKGFAAKFISYGIMALFLGQISIAIILGFGQLIITKFPFGTPVLTIWSYTIASLLFAIVTQYVLLFQTHKSVMKAYQAFKTKSEVKGRVTAVSENKMKHDLRVIARQHTNTTAPIAVRISQPRLSTSDHARAHAKRAAITAGGKRLTLAATKIHPVAGVAVGALSLAAVQSVKSKQGRKNRGQWT